jgi:glycosyltransferase involved in cell wall biosynthesis
MYSFISQKKEGIITKLYVFSLSKRGGGVTFAELLMDELIDLSPNLIRSRDAETASKTLSKEIVRLIDVPHRILTSAWLKLAFRDIPLLLRRLPRGSVCVFAMPHPLDPIFYFICKLKECRIISIIHDAKSHPGERWPKDKTAIDRIQNSDRTIFLSHYVASSVPFDRKNHFDICNFPIRVATCAPAEKYILFTGRMKKYQGLELLLESWLIAERLLPGYKLLVAGDFNQELPKKSDISFIQKWLSPDELDSLISRSSLLVLPYLEASQSGLFMQAASFGIPIVATPVGGLIEQVSGYQGSVLSKDLRAESLAAAIIEGVRLPRGKEFTYSNLDLNMVLKREYFSE